MSTLHITDTSVASLAPLLAPSLPGVSLDNDQVTGFAAQLKAIATTSTRRIDAWSVERGGLPSQPFAWSASTARRLLGTAAAQAALSGTSVLSAVQDQIADHLIRATRGETRFGSLGHWLGLLSHAELGMVSAEAVNWATQLLDVADLLGSSATLCRTDAYFNVSGAQTTLRGRRDFRVGGDDARVVVRVRSGAPTNVAGAGLRTDLFIETLNHPARQAPQRFIGLWPDAGITLSVEGTVENLRKGARDVVRVAGAQRLHMVAKAA